MADDADDNLFQLRVRKIKHAIIADTDAEAVAVFQFLAAVRKRIFFERENRLGDAGLEMRRNPGEFLASVARDFDLPAHARMFSSLSVWRNDWRG
jgi:hypothetical protein